ncbi:MAG: hypothetical protein J2O48_10025 [Solirubrobacterales bacterium]|nr:hypothetical protein [Solirubrobacterales bacterium]
MFGRRRAAWRRRHSPPLDETQLNRLSRARAKLLVTLTEGASDYNAQLTEADPAQALTRVEKMAQQWRREAEVDGNERFGDQFLAANDLNLYSLVEASMLLVASGDPEDYDLALTSEEVAGELEHSGASALASSGGSQADAHRLREPEKQRRLKTTAAMTHLLAEWTVVRDALIATCVQELGELSDDARDDVHDLIRDAARFELRVTRRAFEITEREQETLEYCLWLARSFRRSLSLASSNDLTKDCMSSTEAGYRVFIFNRLVQYGDDQRAARRALSKRIAKAGKPPNPFARALLASRKRIRSLTNRGL